MTTDLQRMHQDEWLSALRSGQYAQIVCVRIGIDNRRCAIGVAQSVGGFECVIDAYGATEEWLGASPEFVGEISRRNDNGDTFDRIADWFKAERDACDGDLSMWGCW